MSYLNIGENAVDNTFTYIPYHINNENYESFVDPIFFISFQTFFNERFFDLFDTEKSGTLDLNEFTDAMTLLAKGSPKDKLGFLFQVYDVDGKVVGGALFH